MNMPLTRTEADETIMRLQGEAGVMRELLRLAHGVIETIEPEDCYESEKLMALLNEIQALLKASAGMTTAAYYCETCNAPRTPGTEMMCRCGTCRVINGKLPPTNYVPIVPVVPVVPVRKKKNHDHS